MKDDDWSDIVLPPNDYWEFSSFRPVTHIEYSSEYKKLCSLFQVVIEKRDISERALRLTERIINICEGHYTAWLYRRTIILALMSQSINFLFDEIQFIRQYTVDCPKNYQLWRHREAIIDIIFTQNQKSLHLIEKTVQEELSDLDLVLLDDSKNYHAWQHRIWLVQHSHLISKLYKKEYQVAEYMICRDVFNNSAWNYRIFLRSLTANSDKDSILKDNESFDLQNLDEKFTSDMIDMCPQNISPWRYLRVIMQWSPNQQLLDQLLLKYPKEFERFYY